MREFEQSLILSLVVGGLTLNLNLSQLLALIGLTLEIVSILLLSLKVLEPWLQHIINQRQRDYKIIRRDAFFGISLLIIGIILQAIPQFL